MVHAVLPDCYRNPQMYSPRVLKYTDFGNLMKLRKDILDEKVDLAVKRMHEKFFFNCKA